MEGSFLVMIRSRSLFSEMEVFFLQLIHYFTGFPTLITGKTGSLE